MPDASGILAPTIDIAAARAETLLARYRDRDGLALLRAMIRDAFPGRIAFVSSFGADAAVLLHLVAQVDPATPVLFLETGQHFAVTRAYRQALAEHIGLTDVRDIVPDAAALAAQDPDRDLWRRDPDACCGLRKVVPLAARLTASTPGSRAASASRARRARHCRRSRPRTAASRSTRSGTGARTTSTPITSPMPCRAIRWSPKAIPRSAAGRARVP